MGPTSGDALLEQEHYVILQIQADQRGRLHAHLLQLHLVDAPHVQPQ